MKVQRPVNLKSVFHSAGIVFEKLMNDEITVEKAEQANSSLAQMNRAYANALKHAEVELQIKNTAHRVEIPMVEIKGFDNIPIEDSTNKDEQQ
jgi:hypothetical protein